MAVPCAPISNLDAISEMNRHLKLRFRPGITVFYDQSIPGCDQAKSELHRGIGIPKERYRPIGNQLLARAAIAIGCGRGQVLELD